MILDYNFYYPFIMPFIPQNCDKPPTMYAILNSIVNGEKDEDDYTKIKDLAKYGRTKIFNFDYPLSNNVNKEEFETIILKHYLTRRINFDTVTLFRISLDAKLNEIMPRYNKMFDSFIDWNLFNDGEITNRTGNDNRTQNSTNNSNQTSNNSSTQNNTNETNNILQNDSHTNTNTISDRRNSELPQNQLQELRDGNYVTDYNYDTGTNEGNDTSTSSGNSTSTNKTTSAETNTTNSNQTNNMTDNNTYNETITKTQNNKLEIYKEMQENIKSIYSLIFNDLDCLFYGLL